MESSVYSPHTVEAVVLAGGKGTRLAPLTEDTPKPCLKILGKTVLESVFDRIRACGIQKVRVTTMYLPWQVEALGNRFGELSVEYVREMKPLGTAGAVRNAFDGESDTVLVLSGDGAFDFDLKKALDFHFEKNADVTIVTYKTENPLDYGVVLYDNEGRIERFTEKPPWSKVISGTVNTGIYILKKEILQRVPSGTEYDFSKQLFPLLLAAKCELYAYEASGVWYDIGNLDEYYAAVCAALDGRLSGFDGGGLSPEQLANRGIEFDSPVYVSEKAVLGKNIKIGAYTSIGAGAVISDGCDIACSVVAQEATLGSGCGIYGTLIGRAAHLGENCVTSEGCAIGGGAVIEDSVILSKYVSVHSGMTVAGSDFPSHRIGKKDGFLFSDAGIRCDKERLNPEYLLRIGRVAAGTLLAQKSTSGCRIGVMGDGNAATDRIVRTVLCGIQAAGVRSYDFGRGFEAMARYAAMRFFTDLVLYIVCDKNGGFTVRFFDNTGLAADSAFERAFSTLFYSAGDYRTPERLYETDRFDNLWTLYYSDLIAKVRCLLPPDGLSGFVCRFEHEDEIPAYSPAYTALCAIAELGGEIRKAAGFTEDKTAAGQPLPAFCPDDAGNALCFSMGSRCYDSYHIAALLIEQLPEAASAPLHFSGEWPQIYRTLAERRGLAYTDYAASEHACALCGTQMLEQLWLTDAVYQILYLAALLKNNPSLWQKESDTLPEFAVFTHYAQGNPNRAGIMERLSKLAVSKNGGQEAVEPVKHDGVRLQFTDGCVTVIPGKAAGFRIISEAVSTEAAKELCETVEEYLN